MRKIYLLLGAFFILSTLLNAQINFSKISFKEEKSSTNKADQIIFGEDFENYQESLTILDLDTCTLEDDWVQFDKWSPVEFTLGGQPNIGMVAASYFKYSADTINASDWLITPKITLSDFPFLKAKLGAMGNKVWLQFLISTESNDPEDFKFIESTSVNKGYLKNYNLNLADYAGQEVYIAIKYVNKKEAAAIVFDFSIYEPLKSDAHISSVKAQKEIAAKQEASLQFSVRNNGYSNIDSVKLNWQEEGAETINSVWYKSSQPWAYTKTRFLSHPKRFSAETAGTYKINTWVSHPNNSENTEFSNDTLQVTINVTDDYYYYQDYSGNFRGDVTITDITGNVNASNGIFPFGAGTLMFNQMYAGNNFDSWIITPKIHVEEGAWFLWSYGSMMAMYEAYCDKFELWISEEEFTPSDFDVSKWDSCAHYKTPVGATKMQKAIYKLTEYEGKDIHIGIRMREKGYAAKIGSLHVLDLSGFDAELEVKQLPTYGLTGDTLVLKGSVKNLKADTLESFTVTYQVNNEMPRNMRFNGLELKPLDKINFRHKDTIFTNEADIYDIKVWLTDPNGIDDDNMTNNEALKTVNILAEKIQRKVLVEEATGTWCGYCPQGAYYLEKLVHEYPDTVIAMAIHGNDPMESVAGNEILTSFGITGFPSGMVDRKLYEGKDKLTLSASDWGNKVLNRINTPTPIEVEIDSVVLDKNDNVFRVYANYELIGKLRGDYSVNAYVLEDEIISEQANYFSGADASQFPEDFPYCDLPDKIVDFEHNHVLRASSNGALGNEEVMPYEANAGEVFNHTFEIEASDDWNNEKLSFVVSIQANGVDLSEKEILNAEFSYDYRVIEEIINTVEEDKHSDISIYPNPAKDYFNILLPASHDNSAIEIYNAIGQKVYHKNITGHDEQLLTIPTSNFDNGIYMIVIRNNNKKSTNRLIISHN